MSNASRVPHRLLAWLDERLTFARLIGWVLVGIILALWEDGRGQARRPGHTTLRRRVATIMTRAAHDVAGQSGEEAAVITGKHQAVQVQTTPPASEASVVTRTTYQFADGESVGPEDEDAWRNEADTLLPPVCALRVRVRPDDYTCREEMDRDVILTALDALYPTPAWTWGHFDIDDLNEHRLRSSN